jgi:hypothetical protein
MHNQLLLSACVCLLVSVGCAGKSDDDGFNAVGGAAGGGQASPGGSTATGGTGALATTNNPRADATMSSDCAYLNSAISDNGGIPDSTHLGAPVSIGNGYSVSCSVVFAGAYKVQAFVQSPEMTLDIQSTDINAGAAMTFFVAGSMDSVRSVNRNNDPAPTCTITTAEASSSFFIEPGAIFAKYDCPSVGASSNPGTLCHVTGFFYLTGCTT